MTKTAVITGATSGIGAEFARRLAQRGYDLVVTGRRMDIIKKMAGALSSEFGVSIEVIKAELSDKKDLEGLIRHIKKIGSVEFLVNNAGFGTYDLFWKESIEEQERMVAVHVTAAMRLAHAVLPAMMERGRGFIVNLSSLGSFLPLKMNAVYGGSKAFLNIFSESLQMELAGAGIRVQALCPGFTRTDLHGRIEKLGKEELKRLDKFYWMQPDRVVDCSLKCLEKGRVICIPGFRNRLLLCIASMIPRWLYNRLAM